MDFTQGTETEKINRAKKNMLWFGMISLTMSFAGLTSAYVVSRERPDWLKDFQIPTAFYASLAVIILSSVVFYFAKKSIVNNQNKKGLFLLIGTLILGIIFVVLQFAGFSQIVANGYYFTGTQSNITTSFIYVVVLLHIAHVFAALITLIVVIYNQYKLKYQQGKTLGIELAATFWHFVDVVWVYLFLFLYFVR